MWFVFPQLAGLGRSSTARHYAIADLDEARAYLRHPVPGTRLREISAVAAGVAHGSAEDVFGGIDAVKLRSSMTLFLRAAEAEAEAEANADADDADGATTFRAVLDRYFDGRTDPTTEELLDR